MKFLRTLVTGFERMDAFVLAGCTKLSHSLQRFTGLTNFFIAKIGVFLCSLNCVERIGNYFLRFLPKQTHALEFVCLVIMLLVNFARTFILNRADESMLSEARTKWRSLQSALWERIVFIWFSLGDVFGFIFQRSHGLLDCVSSTFFSLGILIFFYFSLVDPLPPGKSKVRQWFESFRLVRQLAGVRA